MGLCKSGTFAHHPRALSYDLMIHVTYTYQLLATTLNLSLSSGEHHATPRAPRTPREVPKSLRSCGAAPWSVLMLP